jgi:protein ImuB
MTRLACVEVPALPLQLLLATHREWAGRPVAVVAEDKPQGRILWVNEQAHTMRVLPGQRYAAALSLCRDLCAGEVSPERIAAGVERLAKRLGGFTPEVEPSAEEPGMFWLNAAGLTPLYASLDTWARRIRDALAQEGFGSRVVVGFTRFGTYALARTTRSVHVAEAPERELEQARRVRLDRLGVDPGLRDKLDRLGVRTVGAFLDLPAGGILRRFGEEAHRLHRLAGGDLHVPLAPRAHEEPAHVAVQIEHPEADANRLLFLVKRHLHELLAQTAARQQVLCALDIGLHLDDRTAVARSVRPAEPTLDAVQILELTHLALTRLRLASGAVEMTLTVQGRAATREQLRLFSEQPRRDLASANRAFARIRTEFGHQSVVRARLLDGHLPEARFTWEPLDKLLLPTDQAGQADHGPAPRSTSGGPLVRRIRTRPQPLAPRARHEPDGWLVRGLERGPVMSKRGPYVVSGGWWTRPLHREYYFLTTQRGDVLWVYYDRRRRRWFLQGQVE